MDDKSLVKKIRSLCGHWHNPQLLLWDESYLKLVRQFDKIRAKDDKGLVAVLYIAMSRMNGMDAAKGLRRIDADVLLIFITSLKSYALRGYEVAALDFLAKPINWLSFSTMINRVKKYLCPKHHEDIFITSAACQ